MPFTDYAGTAFEPYILPIIPKGAKLTKHTSLTPDRIGKIPGMRYATDFNGNPVEPGWGGFPKSQPWQEHWKFEPRSYEKRFSIYSSWYEKDGHEQVIGMLGRLFPALDIDIPCRRREGSACPWCSVKVDNCPLLCPLF